MPSAVVIGAGPVGLGTAMLLAGRGLDVTVLDRDEAAPDLVTDAWDHWRRRSVSQFHQIHFLQAGGRALLEDQLPAVVSQLRQFGGVEFNMIESLAHCLPDGPGALDYSPFTTVTTCRRPIMEFAFLAAARETANLTIRPTSPVQELLTGAPVLDGVVHVRGVKLDSGEILEADVVIDAAGRRSPISAQLEAAGARRPVEHGVEAGFVYNSQFYCGPVQPEVRGDTLASVGSISILTLPGDDGHWSVTLYHSPADKPMRKVKDPAVFEKVVRSLPLHSHWADGKRVGEVQSMASTANATRDFFIDGQPCATGLLPVGDAWGYTNPSLGRGITLGLKHAVGTAGAVVDHLDRPVEMAEAWRRHTEAVAAPWHQSTVDFDRTRAPEVEAYRQGLPDPHDPSDTVVAVTRAVDSARHYDAEVLHAFGNIASCTGLPSEVFSRPGLLQRVLDVVAQNPPYRTPGPNRAELEALLV